MKKVEYWYGTKSDMGCYTMYVDDDMTDAEIDSMVYDKLMDYVDYVFEVEEVEE